METESVTLKLPRNLLSGAQRVATARDVTIGHMVRQLLKREVDRQLGAKGAEDRLLTTLQALLERDLQEARDWDDLASRLRPHGYEVRASGDGMVLYKSSCGTRMCRGADIGFPYEALIKRFGASLPKNIPKLPSVMPAGNIDPTRHAMLKAHFEAAKGWPDLINRLACEGMALRPAGADLGVFIAATGRHLCNAATVYAPYSALVQHFGASLPGLSNPIPEHDGPCH